MYEGVGETARGSELEFTFVAGGDSSHRAESRRSAPLEGCACHWRPLRLPGVSSTARVVLSSRVNPRTRSSRLMAWLSDGWLIWSRSAARPEVLFLYEYEVCCRIRGLRSMGLTTPLSAPFSLDAQYGNVLAHRIQFGLPPLAIVVRVAQAVVVVGGRPCISPFGLVDRAQKSDLGSRFIIHVNMIDRSRTINCCKMIPAIR